MEYTVLGNRVPDGRRVFTPEFKPEQINRVIRGEATAAELSRERDAARPLRQRRKQLLTQGGERAIAADEDVVPGSRLRMAEQRIRRPELGCDRPQQAPRLREGFGRLDGFGMADPLARCHCEDGMVRGAHTLWREPAGGP